MGLGARIAEAIEGSEKTKAQIARECGVSGGAVSQWLSGEVKGLKAETIVYFEQATGYRAAWIVLGKGPKRLSEPAVQWPFPKVPIERVLALDTEDRGYVQRELMKAIQECEGGGKPDGTLTRPATVETPSYTTTRKSHRRA